MPRQSSTQSQSQRPSRSQRAAAAAEDVEMSDGEGPSNRSNKKSSPKKKPTKKHQEEEDTESGDDEPETPLDDPKIRKQKVDDMTRYFLMASQTQKAVQRTDVVKNCLGKDFGQAFPELLEEVKTNMQKIFGIDILQSEEKRGFFYLSNVLRSTDFLKVQKKESAKQGLLYVILSNIFMQNPEGKEMSEDAFKHFLQNLGISMEDNRMDPVFGDVKKLITKTFTEQGWLAVRRETNDTIGVTDQIYSWGWRAKLVLSRGDMLNFVSEIMYGKVDHGRMYRGHREVAENEDNRPMAG